MAMMDNNEGEDIVCKGNEWEIVALTESVYAAAPCPEHDTLHDIQTGLIGGDNAEIARAMFMSDHFGYLTSMHENAPQQPGKGSDHGQLQFKHEENLNIRGLLSDEYAGVQQYDERRCDSMSFYGSDLGDIVSSNLSVKEPSMYGSEKLGFYVDEAVTGMSNKADEETGVMNSGVSNIEEDKSNELTNLPCEAWWRRHAAFLYGRAKNANPFWSVVIAAAVVGLAIIGQRWQQDKPPVFQLKSQLAIDNEGSWWILGPVARLKDVTLSGQHISSTRVSCP